MNWQQLEASAPEFARLVRDRFDAHGMVMLGTLRKNGWPRITPIEFTIWDGDFLLGGMWQSQKMLDLLRDPRCAIHSATVDKDVVPGDAKLYGRAVPLAESRTAGYWEHLRVTTGFSHEGPAHVFTVDFESGGYVRIAGDELQWLAWPGGTWQARKG